MLGLISFLIDSDKFQGMCECSDYDPLAAEVTVLRPFVCLHNRVKLLRQ